MTSPPSSVPFQHQVEPVSEDRHPDEPEPRVPAQVEPDGEEDKVGGVEVGHRRRRAEPVLVAAVCGLQMERHLDPPAVDQIHGVASRCSASRVPLLGRCRSPAGLYSRLDTFVCLGDSSRLMEQPLLPLPPPAQKSWLEKSAEAPPMDHRFLGKFGDL